MRIYALKNLPPEIVAVTFAKCSRSPLMFDKIAKQVTEESSAKFNKKWVIDFGHGSIAEHAFLNIAIEDVSLLAIECIESNRLASYTEKSSRYQIYNSKRVYIPQEFDKNPEIRKIYKNAIDKLFKTYQESIEPIKNVIIKKYPKKKNEDQKIYEARMRSKWMDVSRFLLPSASLANLGMTANARSCEHAIEKMLSNPLKEVQEIGQKCKKVALDITPTLIRYVSPNEFNINNEKKLEQEMEKENLKETPLEFKGEIKVDLVDYDKNAEDTILTALLYKYRTISYKKAKKIIQRKNYKEKEKIFDSILKNIKSIYDKPPREFEYVYYTFDLLIDQGAYYDFKRNRIMTQTPQILTADYGYFTPELIIESKIEKEYKEAIDIASEAYHKIYKQFKDQAPYIITKAHARRVLMKMNLRELFYFIGLRSRQAGHFSYRKASQMIYDKVAKAHPMLAKYILVDKS